MYLGETYLYADAVAIGGCDAVDDGWERFDGDTVTIAVIGVGTCLTIWVGDKTRIDIS